MSSRTAAWSLLQPGVDSTCQAASVVAEPRHGHPIRVEGITNSPMGTLAAGGCPEVLQIPVGPTKSRSHSALDARVPVPPNCPSREQYFCLKV